MTDQPTLQCDASEAASLWIGFTMNSLNLNPASNPRTPDVASSLKAYLNSQRKEIIAIMVTQAWTHITNQNEMIRNIRKANEKLSEELIKAQQAIVEVKSELIECKDQNLQKIGSVVQSSVEGSLRDIKSYSEAVQIQANETTVNQKTLQKVVKSVVEEKSRAKDMIIFGMKESESEDLQEKVQEVLAELGEKPPFEVNRFGNRKDAGRPIKVKFKNGEVVCTLLKKSSRLRRSEKFRNVFLCPDRT